MNALQKHLIVQDLMADRAEKARRASIELRAVELERAAKEAPDGAMRRWLLRKAEAVRREAG